VEKFYIYDNESTDDTKEVLAPYIEAGLVEYTFWAGKKQQLAVYDDCFDRRRFEAHWIAVIDLDEFIVPVKDASIPDFLKRFEDFSAVEINWLCYGSGGANTHEAGGVMERFKHHSLHDNRINRHVKSIINPRRILCMNGSHEAAKLTGDIADSHGNPITLNFRYREPQHDIIKINHYAVKSYEEFLQKKARGSVRKAKKRYLNYFDKYDRNDINEQK